MEMAVFTQAIFSMIYRTARETSNMLTKTNISDSLRRAKNKEGEYIILARVLFMTACGKTTKRYKELSPYLTEILFKDFSKIILDFREFTIIKMAILIKVFGQMI
jgi:hypothetical protein